MPGFQQSEHADQSCAWRQDLGHPPSHCCSKLALPSEHGLIPPSNVVFAMRAAMALHHLYYGVVDIAASLPRWNAISEIALHEAACKHRQGIQATLRGSLPTLGLES